MLPLLLSCIMIIIHILLNPTLQILIKILLLHILRHLGHSLLILRILSIHILNDITNRGEYNSKHGISNNHENNSKGPLFQWWHAQVSIPDGCDGGHGPVKRIEKLVHQGVLSEAIVYKPALVCVPCFASSHHVDYAGSDVGCD